MNTTKTIVTLAAYSIMGSLLAACFGAEPGPDGDPILGPPLEAEAEARPEGSAAKLGIFMASQEDEAGEPGVEPGRAEMDESAMELVSEEDASSFYGMTCTCFDCEWTPRCLGKCQAYPNTLRFVGSYPNIDYGHCQSEVNKWCLARNYGYATFACWGHL